jgi:two-component system sensor histidine kinase EvgS
VEDLITLEYPDIEVVPVTTIEEGLKKLIDKELYLFVESMPSGSYYVYLNDYKSIRIVGEAPFKYEISMGVRNDWPMLKGILQKVLDSIGEPVKSSIYHNWISPKSKEFDYSTIWKIFIPLLFILLFTVYWNRRLAIEIKKRKNAQKELDKAFKKLKDTQLHLVQTEKMASVGLLTAGIAHEIKNPLNFIPYGLEKLKEALELFSKLIKKYEQYNFA